MEERRKELEVNFLKTLDMLNPRQRQAVEHIEGPVMVIAGPGTGKTQILSARIGQILRSDAMVNPQNILCLTYTDAGAIAMRERLQTFIGPDAHRVHIFTFHAFCNKVIQENMERFGIRDLQPVSELERIEIFTELVSKWPPEHPLYQALGYTDRDFSKLSHLYSEMKRENLTPKYLNERIDSYIAELPHMEAFQYKRKYREFKAGDPKVTAIAGETMIMEKTRAAVNEFDRFQELMKEHGRYDYDDMILWVKEELERNQFMRLNYQERYLYFLVDEFQDTNGAQLAILDILTSDPDNRPNVFTVGDDDQAIYRFQGAKVKNMTDFRLKYGENLLTVPLEENYRSSQKVLNASMAVIDNNRQRLSTLAGEAAKNLKASHPELSKYPEPARVKEYPDQGHEQMALANELKDLYQQGEDMTEVAVIYRKHAHVSALTKLLDHEAVPYNVKRKINVLEEPFVQNLITVLTYLEAEQQAPDTGEPHLFQLMHLRFFGLSARDVARVSRKIFELRKAKEPCAWRPILCNRKHLEALGLDNLEAILEFEKKLTTWAEEINELTVPQLFERILTQGGILTYIMKSADSTRLMELCDTFFSFIKAENERNPHMKLTDLLNTLTQMLANGITIDLQRIVWSENAVNLITAHSAKGLEFNRVYIICANKTDWEKQRSQSGLRLPDNLGGAIDGQETLENEEPTIEDERRLFYVAMTRAKRHLQISYSKRNDKGKPLEVSRFVSEVLTQEEVVKTEEEIDTPSLLKGKLILMTEQQRLRSKLIDRPLVTEALKSYRLSATHLNRYLACPLGFYFDNILRVPSAQSDALGFGNAVHESLDRLFRIRQKDPDLKFPSADALMEIFEQAMMHQRASFTESQYKRRLEYGRTILQKFYAHFLPQWEGIKEVKTEHRILEVEYKGVPLIGTLDKLEFLGENKVNVVDYKTGKPNNANAKLKSPDAAKLPNGGDYWRQMYFYQILLDSDLTNSWQMSSGEFVFVQPTVHASGHEQYDSKPIVLRPDERAIVENQIADTYQKIMDHQFEEGCGECNWCNFVKNNFEVGEMMEWIQQEEEDLILE